MTTIATISHWTLVNNYGMYHVQDDFPTRPDVDVRINAADTVEVAIISQLVTPEKATEIGALMVKAATAAETFQTIIDNAK